MRIVERLHVSVGVRWDKTDDSSYDLTKPTIPTTGQHVKATVWQAGVVYDVTGPVSLYGSWSQSFNPNSVNVVDASGRSGFDPEKGKQIEAGVKFESADNRLRASVAGYEIKKTNVLVNTGQSFPGSGLAINRFDGEQTSRGVEVQTEWLPVPYWQVQAGWANMHAYISETGNAVALNRQLANAPRNSGNIWTRYNVPTGQLKGFGIGTGIIYVGRRFGGDPTGVYFPMPGYTRIDTAFYYRVRNYDLALNIQNAFDKKFIESARNTAAVDPGAPRKMTLSVNTRF
jgi:iron complex outermembrane receptor protein